VFFAVYQRAANVAREDKHKEMRLLNKRILLVCLGGWLFVVEISVDILFFFVRNTQGQELAVELRVLFQVGLLLYLDFLKTVFFCYYNKPYFFSTLCTV